MKHETTHDVIRRRLFEKAGMLYEVGKLKGVTLARIYESFQAPDFDKRADEKFAIGAFRYGLITEQEKNGNHYDHMGSIRKRMEYYLATGDMDVLPDIANLAKAEWIVPHHPNAHKESRAEDAGYYAVGRMQGHNA